MPRRCSRWASNSPAGPAPTIATWVRIEAPSAPVSPTHAAPIERIGPPPYERECASRPLARQTFRRQFRLTSSQTFRRVCSRHPRAPPWHSLHTSEDLSLEGRRAMPLTSLRRSPLVELAVSQLREQVLSGQWPVGGRLPAETELAPRLGGGRPAGAGIGHLRPLAHAGCRLGAPAAPGRRARGLRGA